MKTYDEVIAGILVELDKEQAEYQETYKKIYGKYDESARQRYRLLAELCERVREEIFFNQG